MIQELIVGKVVTVKKFCFINKHGGTGLSDWDHNERWNEPVKVLITKRWDDDETGERAHAFPWMPTPEFIAYLERNAFKGYYVDIQREPIPGKDYTLYVGEFDLAK